MSRMLTVCSGPNWNEGIAFGSTRVNETWRLVEDTWVFKAKLAWNIAISGLNFGGLDAFSESRFH